MILLPAFFGRIVREVLSGAADLIGGLHALFALRQGIIPGKY